MAIRRPLVSRVLALPGKGEPQRGAALLGYGMLASAVAFSGTLAMQESSVNESARRATRSMPDSTPHEAEPVDNDVLAETPDEGRVPTFFDGHGGVAGVELTEEQRKAVIKEALHRGMTKEQAHDLAYGSDESSEPDRPKPQQPPVGPPATLDGKEAHVLASGPLYRQVAPAEEQDAKNAEKNRKKGEQHPSGKDGAGGKSSATSGKGKDKENRKLTDELDAFIPDQVEKVIGDLLPFRLWMAQVADPSTKPTWDVVHEPEEGTVTVTAESQMADNMTVTVEVTAPVEQTPDALPATVAVTVTDPQTDTVTAVTEIETVEGHDNIPRVAIGEVVEAVISARSDDADAVVRHAEEPGLAGQSSAHLFATVR
ncbi:hypothetical protein GCM10010211_49270 [Streptomyces albospinus]|uniref:Secreted protein n=1 Tax=Streptomyces albospinus TaxID=285515 RepID=A0ABQ2VCY0_9ACTN|nr:hypothetical protein GCM10010211_49270 [Streptomyces albospinus]